ncbi:MAG: response regulator [Candidatus Omnitrophica bacterium]|nr:response regulator [Candidatus Omnitrophota bacterium]MBU4478605.1 response regulator [Candidatus Omnitrophota bacterium]
MVLKHKILIVDDNERLSKNMADILEWKGYEVCVANDGFQAIKAVKDGKFRVVLVDFKMPGLNGVETLRILKKIAPDMSAIMVTALGEGIIYMEQITNIDFQIIEKPIDIDKLFSMIEGICR